ncbi:UNVERIFIED_CONTAM: Pentatricopeptide repeat-containing protein, mitochondrial [Sesamum latifolium]|uniref:Pentatricopeptide repeat-containing protein, mitochondrial n=1 Tax=Sesamum latifolium TaxID=2727402 RepID=A0AAW2UVD4_9LAMI
MKSFSVLNRKIPRFTFRESLFQFKTFTSLPSQNLEVDSIQSISENPFFSLLRLCRTLSSLRKIHALLIVSGETDDPLLKTKLVSLYGTFGQVKHARLLFDEIRDPDIDSCKVMIRWYFMNDLYDEIIGFYKFMRRRFLVLDNIVLSIVLKACSELRDFVEGRKLHGYIVQLGSPDSFVLTGLVDMYAKCGEIDTASKVFERIRGQECACAQSGNPNLGSSVQGLAIKLGQGDANVMNAVVDMYAKCSRIEDAVYIFESMVDKDVVSWNSILSGYSRNGYSYEAMRLFNRMRANCFHPDPVTLVTLLSVCASLGDIRFGSSLHAHSIRGGFLASQNVYIGTALLNLYAKCGDAKSARSVFDEMAEKNMVTWSAIIGGYGKQGDFLEF